MYSLLIASILAFFGFWFFRNRAKNWQNEHKLHSRPHMHGLDFLMQFTLSFATIYVVLSLLKVPFPSSGAALGGVFGALLISFFQKPSYKARDQFEKKSKVWLLLATGVAVFTTIGIVASVVFETIVFFGKVKPTDFLFGTHWSPFNATGEDAGKYLGFIPLLVGTFLITFIALVIATPIGLMSAIYLSEYATPSFRAIAKPLLEVLAGIPTVVLGFFAALTIAPLFKGMGETLGIPVASESALAAGFVMGMMIIPFVSSLSDDVINAIPQTLRDGSLALGATKSETIKRVILPAALPGIVSAFMLALSRAVGETMIVVMAAGLAANLTINPLDAVTTITVQIKSLLTGDNEFDSPKTLVAFALGFVLFFFTLTLNVIALKVVRRFKEQYD